MLPKIWQIPCILLYLLYFISYGYPVCIAMEGCHKMWLKAFSLYVVKHNNIRPETFVYLQSLLLLFRITSFNGMLYIHNNIYMIYIICKVFNTLYIRLSISNSNLPNVVNLTSWTTGQFLVMSRKVISHLYSPSSEVLIFSILNLASEVSDSICSWPLRNKLNHIL